MPTGRTAFQSRTTKSWTPGGSPAFVVAWVPESSSSVRWSLGDSLNERPRSCAAVDRCQPGQTNHEPRSQRGVTDPLLPPSASARWASDLHLAQRVSGRLSLSSPARQKARQLVGRQTYRRYLR